jgi:glycerol-3-phosphate O-acyltransferase / dihydroxyacetone phosphate acyltransferase
VLYRVLRFLAGVALRWYYRDLEIVGAERIPRDGPLLVAGNHPNALVDALVLGRVVPRRLLLTAKATLFESPLAAAILRRAGVVPLRRAADEAGRDPAAPADPRRNAEAFAAVQDALLRGGAVLLFPEGRSHDEPRLSPLRTGLARIALEARDVRGVRGLSILPIGLTFEDKATPRSRVLVEVGEPLRLDAWRPPGGAAPGAAAVEALTREVDRRLRAVTLNFESAVAARRVVVLGRILAAVLGEPRPLGAPHPPLGHVATLARRMEAARRSLEPGPAAARGGAGPAPAALAGPVASRAAAFAERLEALEAAAAGRGVALAEALIPLSIGRGAWFVLREVALAAIGGPLALWGRVNHWIPLRLALRLGRRGANGQDEPAMRTVVAGLLLVLAFYAAQAVLVGAVVGAVWAAAYVLTLPASAGWDLRWSDRREDARRRVRAYLRLRREPALRAALEREIAALREEAAALDALLP